MCPMCPTGNEQTGSQGEKTTKDVKDDPIGVEPSKDGKEAPSQWGT